MSKEKKYEVITFKVDSNLSQAMEGIPNRSEFIRSAILAALDNVCPLCKGTGILTPQQKTHWESFAETHSITECQECHAHFIICDNDKKRRTH